MEFISKLTFSYMYMKTMHIPLGKVPQKAISAKPGSKVNPLLDFCFPETDSNSKVCSSF